MQQSKSTNCLVSKIPAIKWSQQNRLINNQHKIWSHDLKRIFFFFFFSEQWSTATSTTTSAQSWWLTVFVCLTLLLSPLYRSNKVTVSAAKWVWSQDCEWLDHMWQKCNEGTLHAKRVEGEEGRGARWWKEQRTGRRGETWRLRRENGQSLPRGSGGKKRKLVYCTVPSKTHIQDFTSQEGMRVGGKTCMTAGGGEKNHWPPWDDLPSKWEGGREVSKWDQEIIRARLRRGARVQRC